MRSKTLTLASVAVLAAAIAGCSSAGASSTPGSQAPASQAPSAVASTVEAKPVGTVGTVLVAGSNGMTVYTFTKDTKDSGKSVCTADCLTAWPALTVAAGATPTGGTGVTGTLGTITREDNSELQVTYNGMPLYFFAADTGPGTAAGVYEFWEVVKP